ncbi:TetR/AcrR family transcriptional regulator [Rothia nasimurium]|uniref:TetR/AcrR family transcriptional regulator n=1 Tax=Rothia nasimurium TaxID=85336 RepID=UPI001F002852|nr:TetR family transcriptional regulator [Rothia nasimurium]
MAAQNSTPSSSPRGRRSGGTRSREDILRAATNLFAEQGFEGTSVRAIAAQAQVDPALIRHFFGSKEALFTTLLNEATELSTRQTTTPSSGDRATDLVAAYLHLWESPETGPLLIGLVRSALASATGAPAIKEALTRYLTQSCADPLKPSLDEASAELLGTQLLGLAVGRYLLGLPHLVALSTDELIERAAPAVQSYLEGNSRSRKTRSAPKKKSPLEQLSLFDGLF